MSNKTGTCPKCHKLKTKAGSSSITQWISVCICDSLEALDQSVLEQAAAQELQFCSICSKRINPGRQGSFTQYIFRSDLCNCAQPRPRKATDDERLAQPTASAVEEEFEDDDIQEELPLDETNFPIDRYKPLFVLGTGSTGTVYLCRDKLLGKRVAVKKLNAASPEQLVSFQLEAKATSKLNHPNIVTVLDFGVVEASGIPFMVMEYVKGTSLLKHLEDKGSLDVETTVDIVCDLCDALIYAHEHNTFHRDVKPSNIILDLTDDGLLEVRLIDFGVATVTSQTLTPGKSELLVGTPAYMSPDVVSGLTYDARSEQYSIGCTLFEMLTGRQPFEADGPLEVISMHATEAPPTLEDASGSAFSSELEEIVARCLQKLPDYRFQSLDEFRLAISDPKVFPKPQVEAEGLPRAEKIENRKKALFISLLLISIVCGIGAIFTSVVFLKKTKPPVSAASSPNLLVDVIPAFKKVTFEENFWRLQGGPWERMDLEKLAKEHPDIEEIRASSEVIADWSAFGVFKNLKRLNLTTCMLKDSDFEQLINAIPDLVALEVNNSTISDAAIKNISKWKSLRHIELCESTIGNEGVRSVAQIKGLSELELSKSRVTDDGLAYLKDLPLHILSLSDCAITDRGVEYIADIPTLDVLRLNATKITDKSLETLLRRQNLDQLEISNCLGITDSGMSVIPKFPKLKRLQINFTPVTGAGLLPISQSTSLRFLTVHGLKLTDEDLTPLYACQLEEVSLNETPITDKGLAVFLRMPKLCHIKVSMCENVTAGGIDALKRDFQKQHGRRLDVTTTSRRHLSSEESKDFSFLLDELDIGKVSPKP